MKSALIAAVAVSLSFSAFVTAQETGVAAPPAEKPAEKPAPKPVDPAQVEKASKLMDEVTAAYKNAKAMTDTIKLDINTPMGNEAQEVSLTLGAGNNAIFNVPGFTLVAVDEKLNFTSDAVPDKYFSAPLEGDLSSTVRKMFGDGFPLPAHFALRSDAPLAEKLSALALGMLGAPQLTGYQKIEVEGQSFHVIEFGSEQGKGAARIAEDTKLVKKVDVQFEPMPGMQITAQFTMNPKVMDELPKPIQFAAGSRKQVETLEGLEPTPVAVGDMAPDFTLKTLAGEEISLSKLRGKVVVIDFWATWCGPCKRALPLLQEFATWAETSDQGVKVYAINSWERSKDADEKKKTVSEFWTKQEYKMPTLMDLDDSVIAKYGFGGIPATVIVGPDGKIAAIHQGFSADMVDVLKRDVENARKSAG